MSRFSKADAEAKGWVIVHEREGYDVNTSETQGESRSVPPTLRAEKYVDQPGRVATLINEEAETMGLLLERIFAWEEQYERSKPQTQPVPIDASAQPLNSAGYPIRHVITDEGAMTDEEYASRDRQDVILNDDEELVYLGAHPQAVEAEEARQELSDRKENRRSAERAVGPTKQVTIDGDVIDSPGGAPSGVLVVREDEESFEDVIDRKQERKDNAEQARVIAMAEHGPVAPEGAEELAGVDVSIQERSDLGSETPRQSDTLEIVEGEKEQEEAPGPDPGPSAQEIRSEAAEEKAKDLRSEEGGGDKPEQAKEVLAAATDAEQEAADEAAEADDDQDPSDEDPEEPDAS